MTMLQGVLAGAGLMAVLTGLIWRLFVDSVRAIRNEIMHFNPDGIDDDQRRTIRNFARFLDQLARLTPAQRPRGGNDDNP